MTDYIKREDAIKWATDFIEGVEEEEDICIVDPGGWESVHDYCEEAITCMIPSADVVEVVRCKDCQYRRNSMLTESTEPTRIRENVKGRWIEKHYAINCSVCKKCLWSSPYIDLVKKFNFCPNCGADMRGEA